MTDVETCRDSGLTRRCALTAGAVGVSAVALAACSKSTTTTTANSTLSTNPAAGSTAPTSTDATTAASSTAASGGAALAKLADIPVGSAVSAKTADGQDILITRTGENTVVAFSATCTHQGCTVPATFHCPCHGSFYDKNTGARLGGPAPRGLSAVNVKIAGGNVVEA
jgi:Rieske Fe-S protein